MSVNPQDILKIKLFKNHSSQDPTALSDSVYVEGEIMDWTSITLEKDQFIESDGCTITIEDDRIQQYTKYLQRGHRIQVLLNHKVNFDGFIFKYKYTSSRSGGTKLVIECKDLLEWMAQGSIPPNAFGVSGNGLTNFHFPPNSTLLDCVRFIINTFRIGLIGIDLPELYVSVWDNGNEAINASPATSGNPKRLNVNDLDIASGFAAGIRVTGKKSAQFTKSWYKALNRFNTPEKGESYLAMIKRFCKLSGVPCVKMSPGRADTILLQAPTYDRSIETPFKITHYLSAPNNSMNTAEGEIDLEFNLDKQYSVIIVEGNSLDENEFHLSDAKAVAINELSGYYLVNQEDFNDNKIIPLDTVRLMIAALVNVPSNNTAMGAASTNPPQGTNYRFLDFNKQLYQERYNLGVDIHTTVCMPFYETSHNAHNLDQLCFAAQQKLAETQDKSIVMTYHLDGWTQNGNLWQPNMMVNVTEELLSPGNPKTLKMWIRKVVYHKTRNAGTSVQLTLTLPYTHNFELTDTPKNVNPPSNKSTTGPNGNIPFHVLYTDVGIGSGFGYNDITANLGPGTPGGSGYGFP